MPGKPRKRNISRCILIQVKIYVGLLLLTFVCCGEGHSFNLRLGEVIEKSLRRAHDIELAKIDVDIRRLQLAEFKSEYYPELLLRFTNEYFHDLDKETETASFIGDTVINNNQSMYQHALVLYLSYNLYDFGSRSLQQANIKRSLMISQLRLPEVITQIKMELLKLYRQGFTLYRELENYKNILKLKKEVYSLLGRLSIAGSVDGLQLSEAAIDVVEILREIDQKMVALQEVLQKISFYTGDDYDPGEITFSGFSIEGPSFQQIALPDISSFPDIKALELEIENKETEFEISKRERWPSLSLYSTYKMFGDHPNDFFASFGHIEEKSAAVGLTLDMKLFAGFSSFAKIKRLRQEIERLRVEKNKRVAQLKTEVASLVWQARFHEKNFSPQEKYLEEVEKKIDMARKLSEQHLADAVYLLQQESEFQKSQLLLDLDGIEKKYNMIKLKFFSENTIK